MGNKTSTVTPSSNGPTPSSGTKKRRRRRSSVSIPRHVMKANRWGAFQPKVVQARDGEVVWYSNESYDDEEDDEDVMEDSIPRKALKSSSVSKNQNSHSHLFQ